MKTLQAYQFHSNIYGLPTFIMLIIGNIIWISAIVKMIIGPIVGAILLVISFQTHNSVIDNFYVIKNPEYVSFVSESTISLEDI